MHTQEIEPIRALGAWPKELDLAVSKRPEEPLVAHVAHAEERELSAAFLEEHWFDLDVVRFVRAAVVVDEPAHLKDVKRGEVAVLGFHESSMFTLGDIL